MLEWSCFVNTSEALSLARCVFLFGPLFEAFSVVCRHTVFIFLCYLFVIMCIPHDTLVSLCYSLLYQYAGAMGNSRSSVLSNCFCSVYPYPYTHTHTHTHTTRSADYDMTATCCDKGQTLVRIILRHRACY